ncbi:hypothetical protein KDD30_11180 [Photobacterium sp. GJ3]|uniref:hypothetical protein n=1 Tax=Photobacterium sp. GJ3 TaxID=2829502 RepID=UPI001B8C8F32|nr:hypothetical protein [Photobacterium sp. GJ3]QUJ66711.1 hypothetical protein KDD30_11180 [Photobacterium sp. GJ3]
MFYTQNLILLTATLTTSLAYAQSETNAFDSNGYPIKVDTTQLYQDPETKMMHGPEGHQYIHTGTFKTFDAFGNQMIKDCSETLLFTDPNHPPDFSITNLPDPSCTLQRLTTEDYEVLSAQDLQPPKKKAQVKTQENGNIALLDKDCKRFGSYAPPNVWSYPIPVASHIGVTTYKVSSKILGDTLVLTWVRFWSQEDKWADRQFSGNGWIKVTTGNAASSVYTTYKGVPFGSSVEGEIC